jgi:tetratricopeptide (TPR) repeat protein
MSRSIAVSLLCASIAFFATKAAGQTPAADEFLAKADNLVKQGQYDGALAAAKEALHTVELAFGTSDPRIVKALKEIARICELMARNEEAEAAYRRALTLIERLQAPDPKEIAELKAKLARPTAWSGHAESPGAGETAGSRRGFARKELFAQPDPPPTASPAPSAPGGANSRPVAAQPIPQFPWPPPEPSTSYPFPKDVFSRHATAGEVTDAILAALERSGYVERSFYQTGDGGIALVTRLEMITNDGSPAADAERWPAGYDNKPASFADFVRGLFFAKAGRYRVIVFVLQEASFRTSETKATALEAEKWLTEGLIKLPPQLASKPFGKDSTCTALIYEFTSTGTTAKPAQVKSSLTGKQHLIKAGLLSLLETPN